MIHVSISLPEVINTELLVSIFSRIECGLSEKLEVAAAFLATTKMRGTKDFSWTQVKLLFHVCIDDDALCLMHAK